MSLRTWIGVACGALMAMIAALLLIFGQAADAFEAGWYVFSFVVGLGLVVTGLQRRSP